MANSAATLDELVVLLAAEVRRAEVQAQVDRTAWMADLSNGTPAALADRVGLDRATVIAALRSSVSLGLSRVRLTVPLWHARNRWWRRLAGAPPTRSRPDPTGARLPLFQLCAPRSGAAPDLTIELLWERVAKGTKPNSSPPVSYRVVPSPDVAAAAT